VLKATVTSVHPILSWVNPLYASHKSADQQAQIRHWNNSLPHWLNTIVAIDLAI